SSAAEPSRVAESNRIAGASRGARSDGAVGRDQQVREIVGGGAAHQGPAAQARTGGGRGLDRVGIGPGGPLGPGAPLGAGAAHGGAEVLPVAGAAPAGAALRAMAVRWVARPAKRSSWRPSKGEPSSTPRAMASAVCPEAWSVR